VSAPKPSNHRPYRMERDGSGRIYLWQSPRDRCKQFNAAHLPGTLVMVGGRPCRTRSKAILQGQPAAARVWVTGHAQPVPLTEVEVGHRGQPARSNRGKQRAAARRQICTGVRL
jgi:hypothetical protein